MNLDDISQFKIIDPQDMLGEIQSLPDQLAAGWADASKLVKAFEPKTDIRNVLITGMGGSAIAGDLVRVYVQDQCPIPLVILRDYDLPAWVDSHTLVIASSHSGNTEETLSVVKQVLDKNYPLVRITTGGKLAKITDNANSPCLFFKHSGQPRSAVGYSFAYMLAVLHRQGLITDPSAEVAAAVAGMKAQQEFINPEVAVQHNPAKRLAGQMVGRNVTIFGSGVLGTIARRWKGQINELAKVWAGYDELPEACHNTIAGTENPDEPICTNFTLFLESQIDHERNARRSELLRKHLMLQAFMTDSLKIRGKSCMEVLWNGLSYGDYVAYYLAMCYEVDPTPIQAIQDFKKELGDFNEI